MSTIFCDLGDGSRLPFLRTLGIVSTSSGRLKLTGLFDDSPGGWTLVELLGLDGGPLESFLDLGVKLTAVIDLSDS